LQALRTLAGVDPSALTLRDPAAAAGADPGAGGGRPGAALRPQDDLARLSAAFAGGGYMSRVRTCALVTRDRQMCLNPSAWVARWRTQAPMSLRAYLGKGICDGLSRLKRWHIERATGDALVHLQCAAQKPGASVL